MLIVGELYGFDPLADMTAASPWAFVAIDSGSEHSAAPPAAVGAWRGPSCSGSLRYSSCLQDVLS